MTKLMLPVRIQIEAISLQLYSFLQTAMIFGKKKKNQKFFLQIWKRNSEYTSKTSVDDGPTQDVKAKNGDLFVVVLKRRRHGRRSSY